MDISSVCCPTLLAYPELLITINDGWNTHARTSGGERSRVRCGHRGRSRGPDGSGGNLSASVKTEQLRGYYKGTEAEAPVEAMVVIVRLPRAVVAGAWPPRPVEAAVAAAVVGGALVDGPEQRRTQRLQRHQEGGHQDQRTGPRCREAIGRTGNFGSAENDLRRLGNPA